MSTVWYRLVFTFIKGVSVQFILRFKYGCRDSVRQHSEVVVIRYDAPYPTTTNLECRRTEPRRPPRWMSRISGLHNDMNKRTLKINKRCIHFLSKQNIIAPLIKTLCLERVVVNHFCKNFPNSRSQVLVYRHVNLRRTNSK